MASLARFTQMVHKNPLLSLWRCSSGVGSGMTLMEPTTHIPHVFQLDIKAKPEKITIPSAEDQLLAEYSSQVTPLRVIAMNRKLFTPGSLMVSGRVKQAMFADIGRRHTEVSYLVKYIRKALLQVIKANHSQYTTILLSGSGTFANEATLRTIMGTNNKKLLIMENGLYGKRLAQICKFSGIKHKVIPMDIKLLQQTLLANNDIGGVMVVHCETSSGMINPVHDIGMIIKKCSPDCLYFVDAMTSFGSMELNMRDIDFVISNSCKSLQGAPGISFVVAKKEMLEKHRSAGHGWVMDIGAQYDEQEKNGQFISTPPIYIMLGFKEALLELSDEGGVKKRAERYKENTKVLKEEMEAMGFKPLLRDEENPQGYIVTSYKNPIAPQFVFEEFYKRLCDAGHVISTERKSASNCFRVGCIGDMYPDDIRELTISIRDVCQDMRISLPITYARFPKK